MRSVAVVKTQITLNAFPRRADRVVCVQINFLVLDRFPQAFNEDVVAPRTFAIHADGNAVVHQQLREFKARELAALIRVEDFRLAVAKKGFLHGLDAKVRCHRV